MSNILLPINLIKNKDFCKIENFYELLKKFKQTKNNYYNPYLMVNNDTYKNYRFVTIKGITLKFIKTIIVEDEKYFQFYSDKFTNEELSEKIFDDNLSCFSKNEEILFEKLFNNLSDDLVNTYSQKTITINNFLVIPQIEYIKQYVLCYLPNYIEYINNKPINKGKYIYIKIR